MPDLVADLVALRHAGGYRFKIQQRVLRQFADHCRREGYPDGSITKEAIDGFLYGRHLRSSTVRRNELALRQLADHARAVGWDAYTPAAGTRVRVRHQPPYVLTDDEARRCSPRSTPRRCPATRTRRWSTRSCSGCCMAPG
jgi:hypothetical protein